MALIFPRAAAFAERMWSNPPALDVEQMTNGRPPEDYWESHLKDALARLNEARTRGVPLLPPWRTNMGSSKCLMRVIETRVVRGCSCEFPRVKLIHVSAACFFAAGRGQFRVTSPGCVALAAGILPCAS